MIDLRELIRQLESIRSEMDDLEASEPAMAEVDSQFRASAANLLHDVALRRHDLRELQHELAKLGLSSLGRCESWVQGNLSAVLRGLYALAGEPGQTPEKSCLTIEEGARIMQKNADRLLGHPPDRRVRIMVTMPEAAAEDPQFTEDLVRAGMDIMRINCAHGGEATWGAMVDHLRRACREVGRPCGVYMDLAGPNPRTVVNEDALQERRFVAGDHFVLQGGGDAGVVPEKLRIECRMPVISCSHPGLVQDLSEGDRLLINDGKIATVVRKKASGFVLLEVTRSSPKGKRLRSEKGINVPDTELSLPSLTDEDLEILPFAATHADMIGYSFVRRPQDIRLLQDQLAELGGEDTGIVLKIETVPAFRQLPKLLVQAMRSPTVGVMIARGDMAVECGFERLAEIQEEVLWFCEAAHVPVVWATDVLQTFVKKGLPLRGEITDAAMAARAECVMLNKGPHILEGVRSLHDILLRMGDHQEKKRSIYRPLAVSEAYYDSLSGAEAVVS